MALIHCSIGSSALSMNTDINVILPETDGKKKREDTAFPTLYLLHGASDNYSNWVRFTSIERYAQEYGIAVVMPEAGLSFYNNMPNGYDCYTYVAKELIAFTRAIFPLSAKREDTYLAGLSMGGYGTMRIALRNPEVFTAAGTFSGAVDIAAMSSTETGFMDEPVQKRLMQRAFGVDHTKALENTDADPVYLLRSYRSCPEKMPRIYQSCGTRDFLYEQNQSFKKAAEECGLPVHYEEWEGDHHWPFWDVSIRRFLEWLKKGGKENGVDAM